MGRIPDATIQEIRDRADIVGLIGRYVELKQAGRNWKGLCPFHGEKTPSFNVNADRQIFHCFGCGVGGDVISFISQHDNLNFGEAARLLARELGIEIPESGRAERGASEREGIYAALEIAQKCYRECLRTARGEPGRSYLADRGLTPDVIERFGLGYVSDEWDTVARALRGAGIDERIGLAAGLLSERSSGGHYDKMRSRVTFPIHDVRGRVIAFGGRALAAEQQPKYLNTPESPVYHKRNAFYGFPAALAPIRKAGRVIVCEGYFDAIALARADLEEAIATCGTALTPDHAEQLRRRTERVSLLFDGDEAGQVAMEKALAVLLPSGLRVTAVSLPAGHDPDDYLAAEGAEALRALVDAGRDAIEVVMRRAMIAGCSTPGDKADVVRKVAPLIACVSNPVERGEYARRLAVATGAEQQAVEALVRSSARGESIAATVEVTSERLHPRRERPEDRHLRQIGQILLREPSLVTAEMSSRMHDVLPSGPWKGLIFRLIDASEDGVVDSRGGIDLPAMEQRLPPDEIVLLRELAMDESLAEGEAPASQVLVDLLDGFVTRDRRTRQQEILRRLQDPQEDLQAVLLERQALLDEKRAAVGVGVQKSP